MLNFALCVFSTYTCVWVYEVNVRVMWDCHTRSSVLEVEAEIRTTK